MALDLKNYWHEIGCRSREVQKCELAFSQLADKFVSRKPPHFTRDDLKLILEWKHTDARWRDRALERIEADGR
jgi:hypothetical protein